MNNKMTNREALTVALNLINDALLADPDACAEGYLHEMAETKSKIQNMIASLDKKAEAAKSKPRAPKANPELIERQNIIRNYLAQQDDPKTCKEIAEATGIPSSKVSGALRGMTDITSLSDEIKSAPKLYTIKTGDEG